mgnify:CR=1 FL=1
MAAKYIGGVHIRRERAGSKNAVYEPVSAAKQKEALALIAKDFFGTDSFKFKPEFIARLATDRFERTEADGSMQTSVARLVAGVHKELLFHQQGDRSWLVISRNTLTHEITKVDLVGNSSKNMDILND